MDAACYKCVLMCLLACLLTCYSSSCQALFEAAAAARATRAATATTDGSGTTACRYVSISRIHTASNAAMQCCDF
jgi:hypothetical protein